MTPDLQPFFVITRVVMRERGKSKLIAGYYIDLGLTAESRDHATRLIEEQIPDGTVDWKKSQWREMTQLDPAIATKATVQPGPHIWHKSGRIFF